MGESVSAGAPSLFLYKGRGGGRGAGGKANTRLTLGWPNGGGGRSYRRIFRFGLPHFAVRDRHAAGFGRAPCGVMWLV